MRTATRVRFVAEPKHVREVSLLGTSDFGFWFDYLKAEGLVPVRCDESSQVLVVAAEMVYLGIRFTEVSLSVRVVLAGEGNREGMRLLHAFTSSRVFAWCERTLFATPYSCAECQVSIQCPLSVRVRAKGGFAFRAEMSPLARAATRAGDETWEGPAFLPPRAPASDKRLVFGRFKGHTVVYPFLSGDSVSLDGSTGGRVLRPLIDSDFSAKEWVVRADATHGRSKTYRITDVLAP
jgi:hypothetical protein